MPSGVSPAGTRPGARATCLLACHRPAPGRARVRYPYWRVTGRLTARLNVQLCTTEECLPGPPATIT
jgi:hypothetical protein